MTPRRRQTAQMTLSFRARRWWQAALQFAFPTDDQVCILCQRSHLHQQRGASRLGGRADVDAVPEGVCFFCLQEAQLQRGAALRTLRGPDRTLPVVCALPYDGMTRTAIRKWKYDGEMALTPWFASRVADSVSSLLFTAASGALGSERCIVDTVVPVPTTQDRLRKRGFHQTALLAQDVAARLRLPSRPLLCRRNAGAAGVFTQSQTARDAQLRSESLRGAFYVPAAHVPAVRGRSILLLDDVVTTGSTLAACAAALAHSGAGAIACATIASVQ